MYKAALWGGALACLLVAGQMQGRLNVMRARPELGLTRVTPLENAPPVLAFTTVALGGFRGLIANMLWVRANDLQFEGKYFEMVQLADWITKLEPHFVQVWLVQAWNMAYNISVKFNSPEDRWRWVRNGIELLRDAGIPYNPHEGLIYRELAWFFQHKMGQNMDDAHMYYKARWAENMTAVLGGGRPDLGPLLDPQDEASRERLRQLREVYKMDPAIIREIDEAWGPLDWRLPETSAIYWAHVGLKNSRDKEKDLSTLRRVIYQSMQMATLRGRLWLVPTEQGDSLRLSPNLDVADKANEAYLQMIAQEDEMKDAFKRAHEGFMREVIFLLYSYNRQAKAEEWMKQLRDLYPDSMPPGMTVEEYALRRLAANIESLGMDRTKALIEALINQSFYSAAIGEEDRSAGFVKMAQKVWDYYAKVTAGQEGRLGFPPLAEMIATVRQQLLEPGGMDPLLQLRLRTRLGLPAP